MTPLDRWLPEFDVHELHEIDVAASPELAVAAAPAGARLATETRVLAHGDKARQSFRRYWRAVGPFSGLIRKRWLRAAAATF